MDAEILDHLTAQGFSLVVKDGRLFVGPKDKVSEEIRAAIQEHKPDLLMALAHRNLSGISSEFAARLSAEDLQDIATGDIPLDTVQAFEQAAVAREAADLSEHFEERAGILEYDAGLPRPDAEIEAARITATYARNCGYLWTSLRAALVDYPVLLAQVPVRPGPVDALPLGVAKLAVLKDRSVVRQRRFVGAHEVKA